MNLTLQRIHHYIFYCILFLTVQSATAQHFHFKNSSSSKASEKVERIKKTHENSENFLNSFRFKLSDDTTFKNSDYDDSQWLEIKNDSSDTLFNHSTILWLRANLQDTGVFANVPLSLLITTSGAVELYLNGKLLRSIGTIGVDEATTKPAPAFINQIVPIQLDASGKNILAVRFKGILNEDEKKIEFNILNQNDLSVSLYSTVEALKEIEVQSNNLLIPLFLSAVFIVLSVFHFLLFLYFRKNRTNLYYALFTLFLFFIFFSLFKIFSGIDITTLRQVSKLFVCSLFLVPLFFLGILYEVFYKKMLKVFWLLALALGITLGSMLIYDYSNWGFMVLLIFLFTTFAETIRVFIKAWRTKKDGARIFAFGVLFPIAGVLLMGIISSILNKYGFSRTAFILNENQGAFFGFGMLMSMSISMTIYLARDFARVNNKLQLQIREIKQLFDKTIAQETEKQLILENQKTDLERMVKERTEEVVEQKVVIEQKNRDILDNLNYARRIQEAILPDTKLIHQELSDSFILYFPKDIVSGDFYTFAKTEQQVIIAAADCTGHGVTGAFMSMIGSSLLNQIINERKTSRPDLILNELNNGIFESLKQSDSEINDGMDIVMCAIDLNRLQLNYSGANRPLWIIRNGEFIELKPDKFPIGGFQHKSNAAFTNYLFELKKDDSLYLFTDGFADQFGGLAGKKLLSKNFREKLLSIQDQSMSDQKKTLSHFFKSWQGLNDQVDDVLVIGIRI